MQERSGLQPDPSSISILLLWSHAVVRCSCSWRCPTRINRDVSEKDVVWMAACSKISMYLSELIVQSQTKTMTSMIYKIYLTWTLVYFEPRPGEVGSVSGSRWYMAWASQSRVLSCICRYNDRLCLQTMVFQSVSEAIVSVINAVPSEGSKVTNIQC